MTDAVSSNVRTPADYAIEHAEYLAQAAEGFIEAANALAKSHMDSEEDETEPQLDAAGAYSDHLQGLQSAVYEFRKRAERARSARETKAEPLKPELLVLLMDWILNDEGWSPAHQPGMWNGKFEKLARAAQAEWDAIQSPEKSGADPVYVGMDLAKPGSDSTVYFCPSCKTELAWEGDVCGLCFPVAAP